MAPLAGVSARWRAGLFPCLARLREEGCCTDTRLVPGAGPPLAAHSLVLAAASPLLRSLLTPATADPDGSHTLLLPEAAGHELAAALLSVYTGQGRAGLDRLGLLDNTPGQPALLQVKLKVEEETQEEDQATPAHHLWYNPEEEDNEAEYEDPEDFDYEDINEDDTKPIKAKRGSRNREGREKLEQEGIQHEASEPIWCKFCDKRCTSAGGLRCHQKKCGSNVLAQLQCHLCSHLLDTPPDLAAHMAMEHPSPDTMREQQQEEETNCKFCNLEFRFLGKGHGGQVMPRGHQKTCLKRVMRSLQCGHCPVQAPSKDMLLEHMKTSHQVQPPPFPCLKPDCEHISTTRTACAKHMLQKHGIRLAKDGRVKKVFAFSCQLCLVPNHFTSAEECKKHEERWHSWICSHQACDFTCESEQMLQEHGAKVHGIKVPEAQKVKPLVDRSVCCDQCGKRFANPSNLKDHMELHEDKELMCDKCDKVFKRTLNLGLHMKAAHSDKTYVCQYCTKICKNTRNLKTHIAQYHEEKRFNCDLCPKGFIQNKKLQEHIVSVHTKTTPYSCKYGCGRAYNDRSNCRQHERSVHEGNPRGAKLEQGLALVQPAFSP